MKRRKRLCAMLLVMAMMFSNLSYVGSKTVEAAPIQSYMYWDSEGHGWGNSGIKNGCLVLAVTKMLINTGIKPTSYTPKNLYSYIAARTGFNSSNKMLGDWPGTVAGMSSKLYNDGSIYLGGMTGAQKEKILMDYVRAGYQLIVHVNSSHWVYVYNQMSLEKGVPCRMDAINSPNAGWRKTNNVNTIKSWYGYNGIDTVRVFHIAGKNKAKTFQIKYNANGGSGSMANTTVNYGTNTKTRTNTFTRSGYSFNGWNLSRSSDGKWQYKKGSTLNWYAKGKQPAGYSLSVYGNGASVAKTSPYLGDVVTFHATWKLNQNFRIRYSANGGTGTMADTVVKYGTNTKTRTNTFTRSGYTFGGWYLQRAYDGKWQYKKGSTLNWYAKGKQPAGYELSVYANGVSVAKTTPYNNDVVTFYAKWVSTALPASAMTMLNGISPSGTLAAGKAFTTAGKIESNYKIEQVMITVQSTTGIIKFFGSATPNALTYDVYNLDSYMKFSGLPAGNYIYKVTAKDLKGTKTLVNSRFNVKASLGVKGASMVYPSGTLTKGKTFRVSGTVSSTSNIKNVMLRVFRTDGTVMFSRTATVGAKSYNVYNLDKYMKFASLGAGKYVYQVVVTDANGTATNVISKSFAVK